MNRLIKENIEALLQDISTSKRMGRRLINLAGVLSDVETPFYIQEQLNRLSKLIILQDSFDALLALMSQLSRTELSYLVDTQVLKTMMSSLDIACQNISLVDDINYAELTAWVIQLAQKRKIINLKPVIECEG